MTAIDQLGGVAGVGIWVHSMHWPTAPWANAVRAASANNRRWRFMSGPSFESPPVNAGGWRGTGHGGYHFAHGTGHDHDAARLLQRSRGFGYGMVCRDDIRMNTTSGFFSCAGADSAR